MKDGGITATDTPAKAYMLALHLTAQVAWHAASAARIS